uniref:Uncharacterized protein n=1 Tax=Melanopsichium pennsylvanicum 4 TaxID=1398559 RepID=A0A077RAE0_9BASI|nr:uncharacterized protein BN887_06240 [Melanopsichium pennsylvanicum 4]
MSLVTTSNRDPRLFGTSTSPHPRRNSIIVIVVLCFDTFK